MSANPSNDTVNGADSVPAKPRRLPRPEGVWYLLALLLVVGAIVKPSFLAVNNLNSIFVAAVPLILLAIGQTFVLIGREIDLSVGSIVGLSATVCGSFMAGDPALIRWGCCSSQPDFRLKRSMSARDSLSSWPYSSTTGSG